MDLQSSALSIRRARWLRLLAVALAAFLVTAACAPAEDDLAEPEDDPAEEPEDVEDEPGDPSTFRVAVGIDLDTLDPAGQTTTTVANMVDYTVETLTRIDEEGAVHPLLAEDWEVSDDGLTYTFELRQGVEFHDGEPFNADAVVASFERVLDEEVTVPVRGHLEPIETVEAIDEHTVEMTLSQPFAPFLAGLSFSAGAVVSPASIEGDAYLDYTEPVGTGPYTFGEYREGERFVVEKFDNYWGEEPHYDTVEFQIVPEAATRVSLVRAGQVDMIILPPVSDLPALEEDPEIEVLMAPGNRTIFIAINNEIVDDERIRQAMNYAVDKDALIERVLFGAADPVDAPMHESLFGHCPVGGYEYDPDRARELLDEAGVDELDVSFIAPTGRYIQDSEVAQAISGFLAEVGINAPVETMDWPTYLANINVPTEEQGADMHLLGWAPSYMDSFQHMVVFQTDQQPPAGLATAHYSNPEVDDLLAQAAQELDESAREDIYCEVSETVMEEAPWIFLYSQNFPIVYRSGIENISYRPNESFYAVYARPAE
jgi:ABC-type transport system substrate-binding protein